MIPILKRHQELVFLAVIITLAVFFRVIHFKDSFNFSSDQGQFALTVYQQWVDKKIALVGPPFSFHIDEKVIYQGPAIFYLLLIFLLAGRWDPYLASLIYSLFSCLSLVPLYFGVKYLINSKAAWFASWIYALAPYYILYTKFLWNPNFQLTLFPLLILMLGLYKKSSNLKYLFGTGFMALLLLQFHYQFVLVLAWLLFYLGKKKLSITRWGVFILGGLISFSPFLYYEITHHFYNLQTAGYYLTHWSQLYNQNKDQSTFAPHYLLTLSFLLVIYIAGLLSKYLTPKAMAFIIGGLIVTASFWLVPLPTGAFGMAPNWNYSDEEKVFKLIKTHPVSNFNVTNLDYDSLYQVQRYLLTINHIQKSDNYFNNQYLFAIAKNPDLFTYPAYEIQSFRSSRILKQWPIDNYYTLYLLERIN